MSLEQSCHAEKITDARRPVWADNARRRLVGNLVLCRPFQAERDLVALRNAIDRAGYHPRGRAAATEHAMASKRESFATVATVRPPMTLSLTLETRSTLRGHKVDRSARSRAAILRVTEFST